MKKIELSEPEVLREVRRIKERIALEAASAPGYYRRLTGLGARLMGRHRAQRRKTAGR